MQCNGIVMRSDTMNFFVDALTDAGAPVVNVVSTHVLVHAVAKYSYLSETVCPFCTCILSIKRIVLLIACRAQAIGQIEIWRKKKHSKTPQHVTKSNQLDRIGNENSSTLSQIHLFGRNFNRCTGFNRSQGKIWQIEFEISELKFENYRKCWQFMFKTKKKLLKMKWLKNAIASKTFVFNNKQKKKTTRK